MGNPVRIATLEDAGDILRLHERSIRTLCAGTYTPDQIEAWVGNRTLEDFRLRIEREYFAVSTFQGSVAGYVRFGRESDELYSVFVDPNHVRMGHGRALVGWAVKTAGSLGRDRFWVYASLNAVPFYQALGFESRGADLHRFGEIPLECLKMVLPLQAPS